MSEHPVPDAMSLREALARRFAQNCVGAADDPFSNPVLLFALRVSRDLDRGEATLPQIEAAIRDLTVEGFVARASRLRRYLGEPDPEADAAGITAFFEKLADAGSFEAFNARVGSVPFGIVLTAHPTFSLNHELAHALIELATDCDAGGVPLDAAGRAQRIALAERLPHSPPAQLTLDVEHRWSVEALCAAHGALEKTYRILFGIARRRWPRQWMGLSPRLVTLASWVGYDQDGRTDITWMLTIEKRLLVKSAALERHRKTLGALQAGATGEWAARLGEILTLLNRAAETVTRQVALLARAREDVLASAEFARAMVEGAKDSLADSRPLTALIEGALAVAPDDSVRETLLVLHASLATHGLSLAHTHVRLNAVQLHNAIRREIGLDTDPNDPANRRTYFATISDLIEKAVPVQVNFASLMAERTSAKRLMMTIAQMVKLIDSASPVRFLIAETESGFTLLTALYYARLFGVEDHVEISPLFETEEAFDRGEKVIEEALKSPHYLAYLKRQGRIAVQFGFSDSGRFIGQMAATFRIERLRLRLAQLLERHGLGHLEIILFNTHGESIGRGGHPASLADRLRYAAPPVSRAEFARRGIRVREEDSFQGGDGYLMFLTPAAALASLRHILAFAFEDDSRERTNDPIYADPDYAAEFFATVQQEFDTLVGDPDYVALLDLFGTNLLYATGSRPAMRQSDNWAAPRALHRASELRAIPNNAILQQLGYFANTLFGVGRAAAKERETFVSMYRDSPRFARAINMVKAAAELSDLDVTRAYAATVDPGMWLMRIARARDPARAGALRDLRDASEHMALYDGLARVLRRFQAEHLFLTGELPPRKNSGRRQRLLLLHALRAALIQRVCLLAMRIPDFSPQHDITRDQIRARLMRLDIPATVEKLHEIFPQHVENPALDADFGEEATYRADAALSYTVEHETLFRPLSHLHELLLRVTAALTHEIGACG